MSQRSRSLTPCLLLGIACLAMPLAQAADAVPPALQQRFDQLIEADAVFEARLALEDMKDHQAALFLREISRRQVEPYYPLVAEGLFSDDSGVIATAIYALGDIGPPILLENLETIRERLDHHDDLVRTEATRLVGKLKDDGAIGDLIGLLEDRDATVRRLAHEALVDIAVVDLGKEPDPWDEWYTKWLKIEDELIPDLAARLESGDTGQVMRAMHTLLQLKAHRSSVAALLAEVAERTDHPEVHSLAVTGVRNMGRSTAAVMQAPALITEAPEDAGSGTGGGSQARPTAADGENATGGGISTSQVVTILVLLALLGWGGFVLNKWRKAGPARKTTAKMASDEKDDEPEAKKRITFTS